jgi:hypothetical protein
MTAKKSDYEKRSEELDAHYKSRREAGLSSHRAQEHHGEAGGVNVDTVAGSTFVRLGETEVELDQAGVFALLQELQAAFQAVS